MTIYFDMDGTIADLYSVPNWLGKILAEDSSPYDQAEPLVDTLYFENLLMKLKDKGYKFGIISWGSKYSTEKFVEKVRKSKLNWLKKNLPRVVFDELIIIDYSCNKTSVAKDPFGILFDDDKLIRKFWPGESYAPEEMIDVLEKLLKEE